ncbi:MAG TPA: hypothetical protein DGT21_08760 [Armatimonadetes bacterium]|nr:hypothetical protein [Armatimonadota bacterium]
MREISSIVGEPVISVAEGVELGRVGEIVIDLAQGAVMGMIIERDGVEQGVWADDVAVIGPDAVMLADQTKVQPLSEMTALIERRRGSLDKPLQVLTQSGTKVGVLADIYIDPQSRKVVRYEISGGPLRDLTDGTLSFATIDGMVHGRDIIVIPDETIARLPEQLGGLKGAWGRLSETLRDDYKGASEKAGRIYKVSAERLKDAVETAKERSQEVSKVSAERLKDAVESAKEKSQEVSKAIGEKYEHAREAVESKVEELTGDDGDEADDRCPCCGDDDGAEAEVPSSEETGGDACTPCCGSKSSDDQ